MKSILIVEDDESIRTELQEMLNNAGYQTILLENFQNAKEEILKYPSDLILLDIGLPNRNGEIILQEIRKESNVPIMMVTSKNNESDEVLSMSYGADDYIVKPYNPTILLLRIEAILKRTEQYQDKLKYKNLTVNLQRGSIENDKVEIILTKNEMIIFSYLLKNQNRIVSRDELMTSLWNSNEYINDNALTVNISRLRNKLKEIGVNNAIETRKGLGYILS